MIRTSIVVYNPDIEELNHCLQCVTVCKDITDIDVIDNSKQDYVREFLQQRYTKVNYIPSDNIGYGAANNISIRSTIEQRDKYKFHLVLNSDISFKEGVITLLKSILEVDNTIGLIMPRVVNADGSSQSCCHPLPSPMDLIKHRFAPKSMFKQWRTRYDIKPQPGQPDINIPYMHGCFMLFRVDALVKAGLFDTRFFMYPEDIDITRRIHQYYKTIVTPRVSIYHLHRASSRHSLKMLYIHASNMIKYFNKWGWIFDHQRHEFNKLLFNRYINKEDGTPLSTNS